jgi:hypothetical protein
MVPSQPCCNPHRQCSRMNPAAAIEHAAWRFQLTGRDQNIRYADGAWQITEAPRRRRRDRQ